MPEGHAQRVWVGIEVLPEMPLGALLDEPVPLINFTILIALVTM